MSSLPKEAAVPLLADVVQILDPQHVAKRRVRRNVLVMRSRTRKCLGTTCCDIGYGRYSKETAGYRERETSNDMEQPGGGGDGWRARHWPSDRASSRQAGRRRVRQLCGARRRG